MASLQAGVAYVDIHPNMDQFNRTLSRGLNTKLGGISRAIGKGLKFAAIGLTAVGGAAAYAFGQFEESEKVGKATDAVLKSTGGAAKVTAGHVSDLATTISRYSAIDDEAIATGENMLLTFTNIRNEVGKGNDVFDQASRVMTDLSVKFGTDASQSAVQLGKALNDPIRGLTSLRRVGVAFTTQQEDQIKKLVESGNILGAQKIILKELNKEFGGTAKSQATATGKMRVALGELAETAGKLVAPLFTFLARKATVLAQWLGKHLPGALKTAQQWFHKIWDVVGPIVSDLWPKLVAGVRVVRAEFMKFWPTLKAVALVVGQQLVAALRVLWEGFQSLWPIIQKVARFVGEQLLKSLQALWEAIKQDVWPALKDLWNAMRPVVKVVLVLAGAILWLALKILPVVIKILGKVIGVVLRLLAAGFRVIGAIGKVGLAIGGAVKTAWDFVVRWGGKILNWFKELPGKAAHAIASLPGAVGDVFKSLVNIIIGWWNRLDIGFHLPSWIPGGIGGRGIDDLFPDIPTLGGGGIVSRPTLAMVGESGPEAITPLGGRGQMHVIVDNPHDFTNENENVRLDRRMARSER